MDPFQYTNDNIISSEYFKSNVLKSLIFKIPSNKKSNVCLVITNYYENGNIKEIFTYSDIPFYLINLIVQNKLFKNKHTVREIQCLYVKYYENGAVQKTCTYINGKKDGTYTDYYENGQLKRERTYLNGNRYGESKEYYNDGTIWMIMRCYKGNYIMILNRDKELKT